MEKTAAEILDEQTKIDYGAFEQREIIAAMEAYSAQNVKMAGLMYADTMKSLTLCIENNEALQKENLKLRDLLKESMSAINSAYEEERYEQQGLEKSATKANDRVRAYQNKVREFLNS